MTDTTPNSVANPEAIKAYLKNPNCCPFCAGTDITAKTRPEVEHTQAWQVIECEICGETWQDIFRFSGLDLGTGAGQDKEFPGVEHAVPVVGQIHEITQLLKDMAGLTSFGPHRLKSIESRAAAILALIEA